MYHYHYCLQKVHLIESHTFLALHDRALHKKMVSLAISIIILCTILTLWILQLTTLGFVMAVIFAILVILIFPRIYWNITIDRIGKQIDGTRLQFHEIDVQFAKQIKVMEEHHCHFIAYKNIQAIEFTKSNILLFYVKDGKQTTLIIPIEVIQDDVKELLALIQKEVSYG